MQLLMLSVVLDVHFIQSILVVLPHQQLLVDLLDETVLGLCDGLLQFVVLIVQLLQLVDVQVPQRVNVGFVEPAHLDL